MRNRHYDSGLHASEDPPTKWSPMASEWSCSLKGAHLCLLFLLMLPTVALAQDIAELVSTQGVVQVSRDNNGEFAEVKQGATLQEGDSVRTERGGRATIRFNDGYVIRLKDRSQIEIKKRTTASNAGNALELKTGEAYFFSREEKSYPSISTTHVSASIRGTEFVVSATDDATQISLIDGYVIASSGTESLTVGPNEGLRRQKGGAMTKTPVVSLRDVAQWTLFYPSVIDQISLDRIATVSVADARVLASVTKAIQAGAIDEAEHELSLLAQSHQSEVAEAAMAQMSVIETIRGNIVDGTQILARLLSAPDNPDASDGLPVMLAQSLLQQADFQLDKASNTLSRAAEAYPHSALVWGRRAELALGAGDPELAEEFILKGLEENSDDPTLLMLRAFVELFLRHYDTSYETFSKLSTREGAAPDVFFGLGLTEIARGDLIAGRKWFEMAVVMDPGRATFRSYLAKTFFEGNDEVRAANELDHAKRLDVNDPTPWLYGAMVKLADHRPIAALAEVETAIKKNGTRAVYRSRALLDQDLASKSVGLGAIYQRLELLEIARLEAMRSIMLDYGNPSAHFLLADSYAGKHLGERVQTTENLLGRLLIPANFNSAKTNLGGSASLNEYTTLFDRPYEEAEIHVSHDSGVGAAKANSSYTLAKNGIAGQIGYAGTHRDGFRRNDKQRNHQIYTKGQADTSAKTTVAWDGAITIQDEGDIALGYDPRAGDEDISTQQQSGLVRAGLHYSPRPHRHAIAQASYSHAKGDETNDNVSDRLTYANIIGVPQIDESRPFILGSIVDKDIDTVTDVGQLDLQYSVNADGLSWLVGAFGKAEAINGDEVSVIRDIVNAPSAEFLVGHALSSEATSTQHMAQAYSYLTFAPLSSIRATLGATYAIEVLAMNSMAAPLDDDTTTKDLASPKVGLWYEPFDGTIIRAAYSSTLDRSGRGGLGPLEPTFVGGFNQVFDGVVGAKQELFAVGADQKTTFGTYLGVSLSRRNLTAELDRLIGGLTVNPITRESESVSKVEAITGNAVIDRVDAYVHQTIGEEFLLGIDYAWEHFDEESPLPETETYRLNPTLHYYYSDGLYSVVEAVWRYQDQSSAYTLKGNNNFWIFNVGGGYQFRHRQGEVRLLVENILDQDYNYSFITDENRVLPRLGVRTELTFRF